MLAMWKIIPIAIIAISFIFGFFFYLMFSSIKGIEKKEQMNEVASIFVNFVLFIWLGKVILQFPTFIRDPLAILARPADARSFYFAVLLTILFFAIKVSWKKLDGAQLVYSFMTIFIAASFAYEFIHIIWNENTFSWLYLGLLLFLLIGDLLIHDQMSIGITCLLLFTCWSIGLLVILYYQPFLMIYGFIVAPVFPALIFVVSLVTYIYSRINWRIIS